jgi:ABC-type sugar transport system permease subunit
LHALRATKDGDDDDVNPDAPSWSSYTVERRFVGLSNFARTFQGVAGSAAERTLYLAAVTVAIENVLGRLFAVLLNGRLFGKNVRCRWRVPEFPADKS